MLEKLQEQLQQLNKMQEYLFAQLIEVKAQIRALVDCLDATGQLDANFYEDRIETAREEIALEIADEQDIDMDLAEFEGGFGGPDINVFVEDK